ncbi:MAG: hypothetical protein AB9842_02145 [Bacteroidales bacterium]
MDVNQQEICLLHQNPGELIVKYQPIVLVVVQVFMKSGYFRGEGKEEIVQQINEKLLERIEKIRQQYNGFAQLRTYFSAVVRNLCLEIIRKGRIRDVIRLVEEYDHNLSYSPDQLNRMIIDQELKRLDIILSMFYSLRPKLILCLKAIQRIPLNESDVLEYCRRPDFKGFEEECDFLQKAIGRNDKEIYRTLNQLFNKVEGKNTNLDATRKWISSKLEEVLTLLNGNPPRAYYNHETLKILLEKYFFDEKFSKPVYHLQFDHPVGINKEP